MQKKKQARALTLCNDDGGLHEVADNGYDGAEMDATDDSAEDVEDAQDVVDRAFAAFVAAHKIELGIFRSVEWATSRQQRRLATMSPLFSWRALLFIFLIGRWLRMVR